MRFAPLVTALATLLLLRSFVADARADQRADQTYVTSGSDDVSVGAGAAEAEVRYTGSQSLHIAPHGKSVRFSARAGYTRSEGGVDTREKATYVADVLPSGELADASNRDPDYLTVLNQPFAAQLDRQTLADLRQLHKPLPFEFPSPFTGSSLHGFLQRGTAGSVGKHHGVAVRFEAAGKMRGALPDRADLMLNGTIAMHGTAYYDVASALLLSLDTTVAISGTVSNRASKDPVRIVYTRSMRAVDSP